ncbi:MAG: glycosyltransferase, partial [Serratia sp.]|nr:glycosyltransferase [Serratia sp. (in: enterobacteria)]
IYQNNRGLSNARNTGIAHASGDLIAFLDADDLLVPTKLEIQKKILETHPAIDVVFCDFSYFCEDTPGKVLPHEPLIQLGKDPVQALLRGNIMAVHTALLRRKVLEVVGGFCEDLSAVEDWDLWLKMSFCGISFLYHNDVLALYRRHPGSMRANVENQRKNEVKVLKRFRGYAGEENCAKLGWHNEIAYRYFMWGLSLYSLGRQKEGLPQFQKAYSYCAPWFRDRKRLVQYIVSDALMPMNKAELTGPTFINAVSQDLAKITSNDISIHREALAAYWAARAFWGYRDEDWKVVRQSVVKAVLTSPGQIYNRGLVSIFLQSYVGPERWKQIRHPLTPQ